MKCVRERKKFYFALSFIGSEYLQSLFEISRKILAKSREGGTCNIDIVGNNVKWDVNEVNETEEVKRKSS